MSRIFRKVALERLSSPEQLDQLLRFTDPKGWIALGALAAVLAIAVFWGFTGSIPTIAGGEGIFIRSGGVSDVVAAGQGPVEEVRLAVGDVVHRGQVVAKIRQEGLIRQVAAARARRDEVREDLRTLRRFSAERRRLDERGRMQRRSNLERSIAALEREVAILDERARAEAQLLEDGLITKQTLLATEQQLNSVRSQLATQRLDLSGLELDRLESEQQLEEQIDARERELGELDRRIQDLAAEVEESASVVSPYEGRVLELSVAPGDVVSPGTPVLTMEVEYEELIAVLFVPARSGKQVEPGMAVRVSPSTVKPEEYGYIEGEVTWVAEYPSTSRGMMRLLANEELVGRLMQEGPPIHVEVRLRRNPETPSGFRWSSSVGPDLEITSGTLASGNVIVREEKPISLVLPKVRAALGVDG